MVKVLHLGKYYPPAKGGMEHHLKLLAQELKAEVDIEILVSHKGVRGKRELRDGIRIKRMARLATISNAPICPGLPYWLLSYDPDILHIHLPNPWASLIYNFVRPQANLVVTYHSDIVGRRVAFKLFKPLQENLLRDTEKIIATSPNYVKSSPVLPGFAEKIQVIPLGIDIDKFKKTKAVRSRAMEIQNNYGSRDLVLFVGRLSKYKGVSYLIKAMKESDDQLLVIGSGEREGELKNLARDELGLGNVAFVGEVQFTELLAHYYACDIFALPSIERSEAFGIVQLEAMACRKPVISTDLDTGVPFVNQDGETGLVVPPEDVGALRDAIETLAGSPELREKYGQAGRMRVEKLFTKEKMAEATLKLYNEIL